MLPLRLLFLVALVSTQPVLAVDEMSNDLGMKFSYLPAASYMMGTADMEETLMEYPEPMSADIFDETPQHEVTFSEGIWMAQTEVTQEHWFKVMQNKPGKSDFWERSDWHRLPVLGVNWFMAKKFTEELSEIDKSFDYRLPTEAEWEYAARAGKADQGPIDSEDLGKLAWYIRNSDDIPHVVGTKKANEFGLYDMLGNAWEWVDDWHYRETYDKDGRVDPLGPEKGELKVRRGGSYHCSPHLVRPGYRAADKPEAKYSVLGFRVVAVPK